MCWLFTECTSSGSPSYGGLWGEGMRGARRLRALLAISQGGDAIGAATRHRSVGALGAQPPRRSEAPYQGPVICAAEPHRHCVSHRPARFRQPLPVNGRMRPLPVNGSVNGPLTVRWRNLVGLCRSWLWHTCHAPQVSEALFILREAANGLRVVHGHQVRMP
jgi:hypothetical protein